MPNAAHLSDVTPVIAPPFDWSKRGDYTWFSASGEQQLREKVAPLLDFELDKFQVACPARIWTGKTFCALLQRERGRARSSMCL
jgi:hypothetical protein